MKRNVFSSIVSMGLILFMAHGANAQISAEGKPGLVITPTRVEIGSRERSASITIANNGAVKGAYRIELVNKRMDENGNLVDAPENAQDAEFADKMLRLSPRRVELDPGANQSIRILVRKPKDSADGEYRTHLSVIIVPNDEAEPSKDTADKDKLKIAVKANYGVTIPVFVESGTVSASGKMGAIKYHAGNAEQKEAPKVSFSIFREGNKSLYGDIKVAYISEKGKEIVLKQMGGLAIYKPNKQRNFEVPLDVPDNMKIGGGTIKITYQEKEKNGGKVIAQNELKL